MKYSMIAALVTATLITAPNAAAQSAEAAAKALDFNSRAVTTVDISEFDLNTIDGVARAHRRIVSTAYQLCSPILSQVSADKVRYRQCISESVDNAVGWAGLANLTSFHHALPEAKRAHVWKPSPTDWQPITS